MFVCLSVCHFRSIYLSIYLSQFIRHQSICLSIYLKFFFCESSAIYVLLCQFIHLLLFTQVRCQLGNPQTRNGIFDFHTQADHSIYRLEIKAMRRQLKIRSNQFSIRINRPDSNAIDLLASTVIIRRPQRERLDAMSFIYYFFSLLPWAASDFFVTWGSSYQLFPNWDHMSIVWGYLGFCKY